MIPSAQIIPINQPTPKPIAPGKPGRAQARCTVGLLTWNAGEDILPCMESVLAQSEGPLELVWIDNASTDGTPGRLAGKFPEIPRPFVNESNLGFCTGHNQGLAACRTPYYLALNQDVTLSPDYIEKLCDWMDEEPRLAMTAGLILMQPEGERTLGHGKAERIYSAGLVFPRLHFPFELGMDQPVGEHYRRRRLVPGVTGAAMMLRVAACRRVSLPSGDVFPPDFFAYHEEVDLALRLARGGYACGVEGMAEAVHKGQGSGGIKQAAIRARYFTNHWLLMLRHESWRRILRELPYTLRGELEYWLPRYLESPRAFMLALRGLLQHRRRARHFYREFEAVFGPTAPRLDVYRKLALEELRLSRRSGGT